MKRLKFSVKRPFYLNLEKHVNTFLNFFENFSSNSEGFREQTPPSMYFSDFEFRFSRSKPRIDTDNLVGRDAGTLVFRENLTQQT
jgi:hypothetical protein